MSVAALVPSEDDRTAAARRSAMGAALLLGDELTDLVGEERHLRWLLHQNVEASHAQAVDSARDGADIVALRDRIAKLRTRIKEVEDTYLDALDAAGGDAVRVIAFRDVADGVLAERSVAA